MQQSDIDRFVRYFSGYDKAYGRSVVQGTVAHRTDGKTKTRSYTVHRPPTRDLYEQHLAGDGEGLGIHMLREDNTCYFGAIDVDDYSVDIAAVERQLTEHGLPLIPFRTKSSGLHLYLFTAEPVEATVVQRKLDEWKAMLGLAKKTEVFPKQTSRAGPEDTGSWINLPYFGAAKGDLQRAAFFQGQPIDLTAALDLIESRLQSAADLEGVVYDVGSPDDLYYEGPPCLQHLHSTGGLAEGTKRDGMFSVGVYLRKRYPDDWQNRLSQYNRAMCFPELQLNEINELVKSLGRKDYGFKCTQPPLIDHCQRRVCTTRRFGVGDDGPTSAGLMVGDIICYKPEGNDDPPLWGLEIGGQRILIDTDTFYSADAFNKVCMSTIQRLPIHVPPARWKKMVDEFVSNASVVYTPADISETGQLEEQIDAYLKAARATMLDQVVVSGAFHDTETGLVYFRALDLFACLDARRDTYRSKPHVHHLLKRRGATKEYRNFKRGSANLWAVKMPAGHDQQFAAPDTTQRVAF